MRKYTTSDCGEIAAPTSSRKRRFSTMKTNFLPKIILNLLATWENNKSEEFLFSELIERHPGIDGEWVAKCRKLRNSYITKVKRVTKVEPYFVRCSDYLTRDIILEFIKSIKEEHPILTEDWIIEPNTKIIGEMLELTKNELLVLELSMQLINASYEYRQVFENLRYSRTNDNIQEMYARIFDFSREEIKVIFDGFLVKSGFLEIDADYRCLYRLSDDIEEIFDRPFLTLESIEESQRRD